MAKIKFEDVKMEGSDYEISLSKLTGKKITDVAGYVDNGFGFPVFNVTEYGRGNFRGTRRITKQSRLRG